MRVNDILKELTRQLEPMEKQAATARIYLQKKEELKSYDINLFLTEYEQIAKELEATSGTAGGRTGAAGGDEG